MYDQEGHMNSGCLQATDMGPYPREVQYAWRHASLDATHNLGLNLLSSPDEWGKLGPLANETPAEVRNRGAAERKRPKRHNNDGGRRGF